MTTIPARLATMSTTSSSLAEARKRSLKLYRDWYRSAPEIVALYALNVSPSMIRAKKRADFEKYRHITDLSVIDLLLFKSRQDYQETMNCWKQEPHMMNWFKAYDDPREHPSTLCSPHALLEKAILTLTFLSSSSATPQTFLDKFYAGRDEPKAIEAV